MSFNQSFLDQQKKKLEAEKENILNQLSKFTHETSGDSRESNFPEDRGNEQGENAGEVEEFVGNIALEKTLEDQLKEVEDALKKLDEGTYGIDEASGEEIDQKRLEANPSARTNI